MSIHRIKAFDASNQLVQSTNAHGSCTGCFQYGAVDGRSHPTATRWEVEFNCDLSQGLWEALIGTKLIQALIPGLSLVSLDTTNELSFVSVPGIDTLPADQVITALRILKAFGDSAHYYHNAIRRLQEYELTADELIVLAAFGGGSLNSARESDSYPVLAWITLGGYKEAKGDRKYFVSSPSSYKNWSRAGMLLPLIRGEIKPGIQWAMNKGYFKEGAFLDNLSGGDAYESKEVYDTIPDDACLTVNHPIIWYEECHDDAGPIIDGRDGNLEAVTEWVLQKLGK